MTLGTTSVGLDELLRAATFRDVARLFMPSSPCKTAIVDATERWVVTGRDVDARLVVWGTMPARSRRVHELVTWASRRERGLRQMRSAYHGQIDHGVVRLEPKPTNRNALVRQVRISLQSGILARWSGTPLGPSVLDDISTTAGLSGDLPRQAIPNWRGGLAFGARTAHGARVWVRTNAVRPDEVNRNAVALRTLARHGISRVPVNRSSGERHGAAWSTESVVEGRCKATLERALIDDARGFLSELPRGTPGVQSLSDRLTRLGTAFPAFAEAFSELADAAAGWLSEVPTVLQHGDFWPGNMLIAQGRLKCVVDWEGWHPRGTPGLDEMQLALTQMPDHRDREVGQLWRARFWKNPDVVAAVDAAWWRAGVRPSERLRLWLALDWWAARALLREQFGQLDAAWTARNVEAVIHDWAHLTRLGRNR